MADEANFPPLYRRIRAAAAHRWAVLVLSAVTAAEAVISPMPPDLLLAPMSIATPSRAWRLAGITTLFSVLGGLAGYLIGAFFMDYFGWPLVDFYGLRDQFVNFTQLYQNYGIAIVLVGAFTPIPYKVIAIMSGVASLNPFVFILFSLIGRGARFFIVAGLCRVWGPAAEDFLLKLSEESPLKRIILFVFIGALAILSGAFYFEYIKGLPPCELCLWQRWPYYAVAALCAAGLFVPLEKMRFAILALSCLIFIISAGLGLYHAGVEWSFWPGLSRCSAASDIAGDTKNFLAQLNAAPPPSCEIAPWRLFGLSLAGYNVLISLAFAGFIFWNLWNFWNLWSFYVARK